MNTEPNTSWVFNCDSINQSHFIKTHNFSIASRRYRNNLRRVWNAIDRLQRVRHTRCASTSTLPVTVCYAVLQHFLIKIALQINSFFYLRLQCRASNCFISKGTYFQYTPNTTACTHLKSIYTLHRLENCLKTLTFKLQYPTCNLLHLAMLNYDKQVQFEYI